jgi:uncharacterized membrane protein
MGWEHHYFFPFGFFFILIVVFVIFRINGFRRYRHYNGCEVNDRHNNDPYEAEAIIRKRLANGEIDEVEYQRLKEILNK